jgi:uncharacterized protein YodC (DUF2158 family)
MNHPHFAIRVQVRAASGGPVMTVEGPAATKDRLWCTWKEGSLYYGAAVAKRSLVIVDAEFEETDAAHFNAPALEQAAA